MASSLLSVFTQSKIPSTILGFLSHALCLSFPLIEEAKDLSSGLFAACLFVSHNSVCSRQNNMAELTARQKIDNPLFNFIIRTIEARGDNTALIQASSQFDDNL